MKKNQLPPQNLNYYLKFCLTTSLQIATLLLLSTYSHGQTTSISITPQPSSCTKSNEWCPLQKDYSYISNATTFSKGKSVYFLAYSPKKFDYNNQKRPLIIYLQGADTYPSSTSTGQNRLADWVKVNALLPRAIEDPNLDEPHPSSTTLGKIGPVPNPTTSPFLNDFVIITPQPDHNLTGDGIPWNPFLMNELMEMAIQNFNVDPTRIYLIGSSRGGGFVQEYLTNNDPFGVTPTVATKCNNRKIAAAVVFVPSGGEPNNVGSIVKHQVGLWSITIEGDTKANGKVATAVNAYEPAQQRARETKISNDPETDIPSYHWNTKFYRWLKGHPVNYGTETAIDIYSWLLKHSNSSDPLVNIPVSSPPKCINERVVLSAPQTATINQTYSWYTSKVGGTLLSTSASYTTPFLTSSQNYYLSAKDNTDNCVNYRQMVTADVLDKNKSAQFNAGKMARVYSVNPLFEFKNSDFTLEAWIKLDNVTSNTNYAILSTRESTYKKGFLFYVNPRWAGGGGVMGFWSEGVNHNTENFGYTNFVANTWYHVAVVRSNGMVTYYLNGQIFGRATTNTRSISCNQYLYLGHDQPTGASMVGKIDEVRIWNGARTQSEIFNNHRTNISSLHLNLISYWDFNQPSSNQWYFDRTPNSVPLNKGYSDFVESTADFISNAADVPFTGCINGSAREAEQEDEAILSAISLYPNPAKESITIHAPNQENLFIQVIDSKGTVVKQTALASNEVLDISTIKPGLYSVLIISNDSKTVEKLVITE